MKKYRIAVIVSHPIQHFVPQYKSWSNLENIELCVFFASKHGLLPYHDKNFGREVHWKGMQLDFKHEFLSGADTRGLGKKIDSTDLDNKLKSYKPDLMVVYGYSQRLQKRAIKWADKNKVSVCMISDSELHQKRPIIKQLAKRFILPLIYKKIDLFLSVGDANEAYYRYYGVKDQQMIRCFFPIDIEHYDEVLKNSDLARQRIREELGIPNDHKVLLNVGKLVSWKRQIDLVKLSNSIQNLNNKITIILAGTGPDEEYLRSQCENIGVGGVIFAGFVSPNILTEYYCAADAYVHTSEQEPHSLAISEAIYCGKPVILSDRCGSYGPSDDVRHGLNGFVYTCKDINDLTQKINYIFSDNEIESQTGCISSQISRSNQLLAHGKALKQTISILEMKK